jgi:hypothetical protein
MARDQRTAERLFVMGYSGGSIHENDELDKSDECDKIRRVSRVSGDLQSMRKALQSVNDHGLYGIIMNQSTLCHDRHCQSGLSTALCLLKDWHTQA